MRAILPAGGGDVYGEYMPAGDVSRVSQLHELYAQARAARTQAQILAGQLRDAEHTAAELVQRMHAARDRGEQVRRLWLAAHPQAGLLRYSASARLQARLASMPVIEQAKGIILAQTGWPEDQAFDALRRASQRENIKLRDLAAKIVARTVEAASGQSPDQPAHAATVAAIAGAAARRHSRMG